jgi:hypothetical protein
MIFEVSVPILPSCLLEPVWGEFAAVLGERPESGPAHPLGCHRRRIGDRVVFEHVIAALVRSSPRRRAGICVDQAKQSQVMTT